MRVLTSFFLWWKWLPLETIKKKKKKKSSSGYTVEKVQKGSSQEISFSLISPSHSHIFLIPYNHSSAKHFHSSFFFLILLYFFRFLRGTRKIAIYYPLKRGVTIFADVFILPSFVRCVKKKHYLSEKWFRNK